MAKCEFCGGHAQSYHNRLVCFHHRKTVRRGEHYAKCEKCGKESKQVQKVKVGWFRHEHWCQSCIELNEKGDVAGELGVDE